MKPFVGEGPTDPMDINHRPGPVLAPTHPGSLTTGHSTGHTGSLNSTHSGSLTPVGSGTADIRSDSMSIYWNHGNAHRPQQHLLSVEVLEER